MTPGRCANAWAAQAAPLQVCCPTLARPRRLFCGVQVRARPPFPPPPPMAVCLSLLQRQPVRARVRGGGGLPAGLLHCGADAGEARERRAGHGSAAATARAPATMNCMCACRLACTPPTVDPLPAACPSLSPQCMSRGRRVGRCCAAADLGLAVVLCAAWLAAAAAATIYGMRADAAGMPRGAARTAVWAMAWVLAGLWALSALAAVAARRAARRSVSETELSGERGAGRAWLAAQACHLPRASARPLLSNSYSHLSTLLTPSFSPMSAPLPPSSPGAHTRYSRYNDTPFTDRSSKVRPGEL